MTNKKKNFRTLLAFVLTLSIFTFSMTAYAAKDDVKAPQTDEEWDAILDDDQDVADDIIPCGIASYTTLISNDTTGIQPFVLLERY